MDNVKWHGTWDFLDSRVNAAQDEMQRMLSTTLYGDDEPARVLSAWERLSRYILVRRGRIHDAWLVLIGKADIGY